MSEPTIKELIYAVEEARGVDRASGCSDEQYDRVTAAIDRLRRIDPDDPAAVERVRKAYYNHDGYLIDDCCARAILRALVEG